MNLIYDTGIKSGKCTNIPLTLLTTEYIGDIAAMTTLKSILNLSENQEMNVCAKKIAEIKRKAYLDRTKKQRTITQKKYRELHKEKITLDKKNDYIKNRDNVLKRQNKYYAKNRDAILKKTAERYQACDKEDHLSRCMDWVKNNPERRREISAKYSKKYRSTLKGRLNTNVSQAVYSSLIKGMKAGRRWETLLDFSVDQLRSHLEKKFDKNMTWENYGLYWEIDHIAPIAKFNFEKPEDEDFKRCWSLKNLQPLEALKNRSKGARLKKPLQQSLIFGGV